MRKMRVGSLSLTGTKSKKSKDTAWFVKTKPLPLSSKGLGYVLSFWLDSNMVLKNTGGSEQYSSSVIWYDHAGKTVSRDPFALRMSKAGRRRVAMVGSVPLAAESFAVQLGFDRPNVVGNECIKFDSLAFSVMPHETDPEWMHVAEPEAPRIMNVRRDPFIGTRPRVVLSV